ncbi:MAG: hypothetical protein V1724_04035 [Chloroflexota bacterium]
MSQQQAHKGEPGPLTAEGWGAFFFQPIFVGSPLDKAAVGKLEGQRQTLAKALDTEYKGHKVIVTRKGLIVIGEEDMARAAELLNEIMATLLVRSIPVCAVREGELVKATIALTNMEIESFGLYDTVRHRTPVERGDKATRFYPPKNIESMIRRAEVLTGDSNIRMDLLLLLEAYTQHQDSAYMQSFLFSWLAVERWLESSWQAYLQEQGISASRQGALTDPTWTTDRILEVLNLCGRIDSTTYNKMIRFLHKRNEVLYTGAGVAGAESEACFYLIFSLVRKTRLTSE